MFILINFYCAPHLVSEYMYILIINFTRIFVSNNIPSEGSELRVNACFWAGYAHGKYYLALNKLYLWAPTRLLVVWEQVC